MVFKDVEVGEKRGSAPPLSLSNLISSISLALDLAERRHLQHARRVAYIAVRLAQVLGLGSMEQWKVYYAGMLHDVGQIEGFGDLAREEKQDDPRVRYHPVRGSQIIAALPHLSEPARIVRYHHEHWDGSGYPFCLRGEEIPLESQLLLAADRLDLAYNGGKDFLASRAAMAELLALREGSWFSPQVVAAARSLLKQISFVLDLANHNLERVTEELAEIFDVELLRPELKEVGSILAGLIDNKSRYTADHSHGVANLAELAARHLGWPKEKVERMAMAGLLHDLGKVAVPNAILDKPGALTEEEFEIIKIHPYYTERILGQIRRLEEVAAWAAMHHEKLDGTGYHAGLRAEQIPQEARIIAACDMFQSLTSERPYRRPMTPEDALKIMQQRVRAGHLDAEAVEVLRETQA